MKQWAKNHKNFIRTALCVPVAFFTAFVLARTVYLLSECNKLMTSVTFVTAVFLAFFVFARLKKAFVVALLVTLALSGVIGSTIGAGAVGKNVNSLTYYKNIVLSQVAYSPALDSRGQDLILFDLINGKNVVTDATGRYKELLTKIGGNVETAEISLSNEALQTADAKSTLVYSKLLAYNYHEEKEIAEDDITANLATFNLWTNGIKTADTLYVLSDDNYSLYVMSKEQYNLLKGNE